MQISPVSFKSLILFTLNDDRPKASLDELINAAFKNNRSLSVFKWHETEMSDEVVINSSIINSLPDFADKLDKIVRKKKNLGYFDIYLTKTDFVMNTKERQKRYFITCESEEQENFIHKLLSKSNTLYCGKFIKKEKSEK